MTAVAIRESPNEPLNAPSGVRILIVDDDPRIRRAIGTALGRSGFHVITAEDGGPALTLSQTTPPDLAIVDYDMPTPGLGVVRELKARHGQTIWIAVLSGHDDPTTRAACFDAGADDVMVKPAAIGELRRRMIAAARTQQAYVETRLARERADRLLAYGAEASAMLAHDLNNGLAVALGNMTYLRDVLEIDEDAMQALVATTNALRRMSSLVANFVDIARFEDAAVKPQCVATNVFALMQSVIDVHGAVPARGIRYELACAPDMIGTFDPALIERVLHNLVGNATRYCNVNGTIRLTATTADSLEGSAVDIVVYNSGPQISPALRDRLFGKYEKGSTGKRGFGLYFCRLACEAHAGTIEHVEVPDGTAFRIRIPNR